ncbi:MAG: tetratricopeptide repeat protein, partial [Planctomycetota bacterium]
DLKPSNIIVTDEATREDTPSTTGTTPSGQHLPEIKILDFGLARITEGDVAATTMTTEVGVIKGTLAYMSPEQARGNPDLIDLRTDVYALGVILYEMLTGARPYDTNKTSLIEAVRVICEEPAQPLSRNWSGVRKLDPDIETIVGKALEKEADRRYASAAALSEDVARYLTLQPILARPPSTIYQLKKLVARHKAPFTFAAALLVMLIGFGVWMSVLYTQAEANLSRALEAEAAATKEAETAKQVSNFVVGLFEVSDPGEARGNTITAREILDKGAEDLRKQLGDQPEVQARLMATVGDVYQSLGLYGQARPLLEQALTQQRELLGEGHQDTLSSATRLAGLSTVQGHYAESEKLLVEALGNARRELGEDHPATLSALSELGHLYYEQGRTDEVEPLWTEALEHHRRVRGEDHADTLRAMSDLANLYDRQGRHDDAEPLYIESLEISRRAHGEDHPGTLVFMSNLCGRYTDLGRYGEAEPLCVTALEGQLRVLGEEHRDTVYTMNNLALLYTNQGRYDEAEPLHLRTLETRRRVLGEEHVDTLQSMNNLALLYKGQGRCGEAEPLYAEAVRRLKRVMPPGFFGTGITLIGHGQCLTKLERFEEAETALLEAHEMLAATLGPEHQFTVKWIQPLVELYDAWGKRDSAAKWQAKLPPEGA